MKRNISHYFSKYPCNDDLVKLEIRISFLPFIRSVHLKFPEIKMCVNVLCNLKWQIRFPVVIFNRLKARQNRNKIVLIFLAGEKYRNMSGK